MIRFSHTIIITTVLFMLCVGYGLWSSSHFENFSEEIIEEYSVGILPDELLDNTIKKIRETGDDNEYIFKVTCESGLQYNFACATQCVRIDKVYRGGQELVGSTINVLVANRIFLDMRSINMSFVGEMKPGKEYLVLLNDCIKTPYMDIYNSVMSICSLLSFHIRRSMQRYTKVYRRMLIGLYIVKLRVRTLP